MEKGWNCKKSDHVIDLFHVVLIINLVNKFS